MPFIVDTKDPAAVAGFVRRSYSELFPGASRAWISRVFEDIETFFTGRHPAYGPIDLRYHDLEHTLQATVCLVELLAGRHHTGSEPRASARQFELTIVAVLLHDTGYLKLRSDTSGTGAKYTFCHVLRSCAFAASYLPALGATPAEIESVIGAINCTGPSSEISRLHFREPVDRELGCALATADYLGQLAAPDYPNKLDLLFAEFAESDLYVNVSEDARLFKSARHLAEQTPLFWERFVLPRLDGDFRGVYRFLASPYPTGKNAYITAAERNIAAIKQRLTVSTLA
jgi:hypothetical protein